MGSATLSVFDGSGHSIAQAAAYEIGVNGKLHVGRTDAAGRLACDKPTWGPNVRLVIVATGFATLDLEVADSTPRHLDAVLVSEGTIRGRVLTASGLPPPVPITVIAKRGGVPLDQHDWVRGYFAADPSVARATTDERGEFRIVGLARNAKYALFAGGPSWLMEQPKLDIACDVEPVALIVEHVLAVTFIVRDKGTGQPLLMSPESWKATRLTRGIESSAQRTLPFAGTVSAFLAGVPFAAERAPRNRVTHIVVGDDDSKTAGPIVVRITVPGTSEVEARAVATSIEHGIPEVDVWVPYSDVKRGSLRVVFIGEPTGGWRAAQHAVSPLQLRMESGDGKGLVYSMAEPTTTDLVLRDIPVGDYTAWFVAHGAGFRFPAIAESTLPVTIREEVEAQLAIDLTGTGSIDFDVVDEQGRPFEGLLRYVLRRLEPTPHEAIGGIRAPPYSMSCLAPGMYEVESVLLTPSASSERNSNRFEVRIGETTKVGIRIASH